jgi:hypothetical protein
MSTLRNCSIATKEQLAKQENDRFLRQHATAIRRNLRHTIKDIIDSGKRLNECKRIVGRGNWLPWLKQEFGWTDKTAENFINVYKFAGAQFEKFSNLNIPVSSLYLIAAPSTPEAARAKVIKQAEAGKRLSTAQVKFIVQEHKPQTLREAVKKLEVRAEAEYAIRGPERSPRRKKSEVPDISRFAEIVVRELGKIPTHNMQEKLCAIAKHRDALTPEAARVLADALNTLVNRFVLFGLHVTAQERGFAQEQSTSPLLLPAPAAEAPAETTASKKLATYKRRVADLEAKNKALEAESVKLKTENNKLKAENDTLKVVAKEATETAVKLTGGTVKEASKTKGAASVSNGFIHEQWNHVVGLNEGHDKAAPVVAAQQDDDGAQDDGDGLDIPEFLKVENRKPLTPEQKKAVDAARRHKGGVS